MSPAVLRPGGRLVVSVAHPFAVFANHHRDGRPVNNFETLPACAGSVP